MKSGKGSSTCQKESSCFLSRTNLPKQCSVLCKPISLVQFRKTPQNNMENRVLISGNHQKHEATEISARKTKQLWTTRRSTNSFRKKKERRTHTLGPKSGFEKRSLYTFSIEECFGFEIEKLYNLKLLWKKAVFKTVSGTRFLSNLLESRLDFHRRPTLCYKSLYFQRTSNSHLCAW